MGIYSSSMDENCVEISEESMRELGEAFIYEQLASLSDEDKKAFIMSEECTILEQKGMIGRKTIVRLNKNDDMNRRTTMAAFVICRDSKDPLWNKYLVARMKERKLRTAIIKKYSAKAIRLAKEAQREYLSGKSKPTFIKKADISYRA